MSFEKRWSLSIGGLAIATLLLSLSSSRILQAKPPVRPNSAPNSTLIQSTDSLLADVQTLVNFGSREAGTPAAEQASQFLVDAYRKAGYQVEIQTFSYPKYMDSGSKIIVGEKPLDAWAMIRSIPGKPSGKLVAVPNVGTSEDFATVDVRNAIAIVKRGEIPFTQKVENAERAGAIGVVIVNDRSGNVRGTLTATPKIPVVALPQTEGTALIEQAQKMPTTIRLEVNARSQAIGRNIVAFKPGVTQPRLVIGAHYDSVADSPGANDNASGTAVVLGLARQLANTPRSRQVWFVAFDGEEDGLKGSRAFVAQAKPEFLKGLRGMVNFDMVGVNDRLQVHGSSSLSSIAKSIHSPVGSNINGSSDHAAFSAKKVPILFFHRGLDANYHKPNDKVVNSHLLHETQQTALKVIHEILK
jgi:Zn-dependent M28 family amino/carboxypeptidase